MRWIFYSLLIINMAFFGWHQLRIDDAVPASKASQAEAGVLSIRLLSEVGEDAEVGLTDRPETRKCDIYGPFFSSEEGLGFLNAVKGAGLQAWQEQEKIKLKPYFWLYIEPFSSEAKAQEVVNRLRGDQLNAEIIFEGRLKNGISIGNVDSAEDVERLRQRLSVFNLEVREQQKSRDYQQFWVVLDPSSEGQLPGEVQDRLIQDYPEIFHRQKVCKAVASGI